MDTNKPSVAKLRPHSSHEPRPPAHEPERRALPPLNSQSCLRLKGSKSKISFRAILTLTFPLFGGEETSNTLVVPMCVQLAPAFRTKFMKEGEPCLL